MDIKKFKLKENISINELLKDGFSYSCDSKYLSKVVPLKQNIIVWLKVSLLNYTLEIEVIDDDFGQYYTPFYKYQDKECKMFNFLKKIIDKYNYEMSRLNSLVEVI